MPLNNATERGRRRRSLTQFNYLAKKQKCFIFAKSSVPVETRSITRAHTSGLFIDSLKDIGALHGIPAVGRRDRVVSPLKWTIDARERRPGH